MSFKHRGILRSDCLGAWHTMYRLVHVHILAGKSVEYVESKRGSIPRKYHQIFIQVRKVQYPKKLPNLRFVKIEVHQKQTMFIFITLNIVGCHKITPNSITKPTYNHITKEPSTLYSHATEPYKTKTTNKVQSQGYRLKTQCFFTNTGKKRIIRNPSRL